MSPLADLILGAGAIIVLGERLKPKGPKGPKT